MEFVNFSQEERELLRRVLGYVQISQAPLELLPKNTQVVKTSNFFAECEEQAAYTSGLGLENSQARLVFTSAWADGHKILLNAEAAQGKALVHVLLVHLIHLAHFIQYGQEHGNVHRYGPEEALANAYFEFLLWTRFRAIAISARAEALLAWHEAHGPEPPRDGCYSFGGINFHAQKLAVVLARFLAPDEKERNKKFWPLLEQLVAYLGGLACYQNAPQPRDLDADFPGEAVEKALGLVNVHTLYSALLRAKNYSQWKTEKQEIRKAVLALREWSKSAGA